jgi:hypothetical protein
VLQQLSAMRAGASQSVAARDHRSAVAPASAASAPAASMQDVDENGAEVASGHEDAGVALGSARSDGGWQPVPVPPPTYTLKPKARPAVRRPVAEPGARGAAPPDGSARSSAPEHADVQHALQPAPTFDLEEILERRIAAGG